FHHIAQTSFTIETTAPEVTEKLIEDYWLGVVELVDASPPIKHRLQSQSPKWTGSKLMVGCIEELELLTMKAKYAERISDTYRNFGFPHLAVDFHLVEASEEEKEKREKMLEQRRLEEAELSRQAIE